MLQTSGGSRMASERCRSWGRRMVAACLLALAGCAGPRLDRALLADRNPASHESHLADHYSVQCPDTLTVRVQGVHPWQRNYRINADGRIEVENVPPLRVDGLTAPEVAAELATQLALPAEAVEVRVAVYESRQLFVHGEEGRLQRAEPWIGPETVVDFLQRIGGLGPSCAPGDVQVVRSHIADGRASEVFPVDLEAIVVRHDLQSNVRLEPFDQVNLGQSSRSNFSRCLPLWLRPLFDGLSGLHADSPRG
jgi:protein involved in polysaccharide export with SLBB domain